MSTLISFDGQGKIIGRTTAPAAMVEQAAEGSDFAIAVDGVFATEQTHYVEAGALVEKPDPPSGEHIFDYATKQWVYDLTNHRLQKWAEIKSQRSTDEFGVFSWNEHVFDCDEASQRRILGAVQLAQLDATTSIDWTLADNSTQTFNANDLKQIGQALAAHVSACHSRARALRSQINAAETEAELDLITW